MIFFTLKFRHRYYILNIPNTYTPKYLQNVHKIIPETYQKLWNIHTLKHTFYISLAAMFLVLILANNLINIYCMYPFIKYVLGIFLVCLRYTITICSIKLHKLYTMYILNIPKIHQEHPLIIYSKIYTPYHRIC